MIVAVHHIAIIVSSEESLDFYKLLGFRENYRRVRDYDTVVLMNHECGIELEIFVDPRHPKNSIDGRELPIGYRHMALKVDNLESEAERLRSLGIDVGDIVTDWKGQRYCFVKDYDGIVVELHE